LIAQQHSENRPRADRLGSDAADVPITHTWSDIDAKLVLRHPTSEKPVNLRLAPMVMEELNRLTKLPTSGPMIVSEAMKQPREPRVPTPVAYPGQCDGSAETPSTTWTGGSAGRAPLTKAADAGGDASIGDPPTDDPGHQLIQRWMQWCLNRFPIRCGLMSLKT
jgi:hypothetical protein